MGNRLASESSPYLLQHKDNPVDWYPWGREAFEAARHAGKPVFVSIGYAACHWCHVMAHECFEDAEIAELMNELFVNVKVDREERPDVDTVYMNAIHVMGEGGGWPLSAFCDPDGRPYFLGTYFPPTDKYGRPGFPSVLKTMSRVFHEQRDKVDGNAAAVLDGLQRIDEHYRRMARSAAPGGLERGVIITAARALVQASDPVHGGLGSRPKFPSSSAHELLARASRLPFGGPARDAFLLQAENMAEGGIYDHLGGGFARYSVDERWLVPHFEKMLYDNAQLLGIYADAVAIDGRERFRQVIEETVAYLERDLSDPAGGLYASQDADSEGVEGKFYVWGQEEIESVLGPARSIQFCRAYGVSEGGNFEGMNVLERVTERRDPYEEKELAAMRAELFETRAGRVPPATDTKVLAGWNGLAVTGLVRAYQATGHQPARDLAVRVADFLLEAMSSGSGAATRLTRVFKDGTVSLEGTVDDYAFVADGLMRLSEVTGEPRYWQRAAELLQVILERFYADEDGAGVFYMTPHDDPGELVHRPESHQDGAIPSGASAACLALLRWSQMSGDRRGLEISEHYLAGRVPQVAEQPFAGAHLLAALDQLLHGAQVVVSEGRGHDDLVRAFHRAYAPTAVLAGPWASEDILGGKEPVQGSAAAYLCRGQTCSAPITDPAELEL